MGCWSESMIINPYNWPAIASNIAHPADPEDYDEAATERLMQLISPHIIDVKGVRYQFKATNRIQLISFDSPESEARYQSAYLRYLEAIGKMEDEERSGFALLVEWLKFRQAAELERAPWIARNLVRVVNEGKAGVFGLNFIASIAMVTKLLVEQHGVSRDDISLIWGGSKLYTGKVVFYTMDEIREMLEATMLGQHVDPKKLIEVRKQLIASQSGLGDLDPALRLGPQSAEERQNEIIKAQSGKSNYIGYSFKSGGVGLSLHHCDEYTKEKVRRKKDSNYAVEEDIPKIPTRQREGFYSPTYSAIELVQALGRCPRITSLSNTLQTLVYFRGTIEQQVAAVTSAKLKCLRKIIRNPDQRSWEDMIVQSAKKKEVIPKQDIEIEDIEHDNNISTDEEDED